MLINYHEKWGFLKFLNLYVLFGGLGVKLSSKRVLTNGAESIFKLIERGIGARNTNEKSILGEFI